MTKPEKLESLLLTIVETIGRKTHSPEIRHFANEALLSLQVDGQDQGRFVGKNGLHIWAIQTIFWYAGLAQFGYSYSVRLLEPKVPRTDRRPQPFCFRPEWDRVKIRKLIDEILLTCTPCHASCDIKEESETMATAHLRIQKYLKINMGDPSFTDAFATVLRVAGLSQGANIKTEAFFE